jgi:hypothetical protein
MAFKTAPENKKASNREKNYVREDTKHNYGGVFNVEQDSLHVGADL